MPRSRIASGMHSRRRQGVPGWPLMWCAGGDFSEVMMLLNFVAAFIVTAIWTGTLLAAIFAEDDREDDSDA